MYAVRNGTALPIELNRDYEVDDVHDIPLPIPNEFQVNGINTNNVSNNEDDHYIPGRFM